MIITPGVLSAAASATTDCGAEPSPHTPSASRSGMVSSDRAALGSALMSKSCARVRGNSVGTRHSERGRRVQVGAMLWVLLPNTTA